MSMSAHEPFLDAIRVAPDDDAPRLIYADWLEEQGDEALVAHGRFIRLQIESDRAPPHSPERETTAQHAKRLLERFGAAWRAPFVALGARLDDHRRGFPTALVARRGWRGERLDDVARLAPALRALRVGFDGDLATAKWFREAPPFRVTTLAVHGRFDQRFPAADQDALAESPWLDDLSELSVDVVGRSSPVSSAGVDPEAAPVLRAVSRHPRASVRVLELLRSNWAWNEGVAASLEGLSVFDRVERLGLPRHAHFIDVEATLRFWRLPRMVELSLSGVPFRSRGPLPIPAESLRRLRSLEVIGGYEPALASMLAASRENLTALENLDLTHSRVEGYELARWPRDFDLPKLTRLRLSHNKLGPEGARALAASSIVRNLRELRLVETGIGDAGAWALAGGANFGGLELLDVRGNHLTAWAETALRDAPQLASVKRLYL